MIKFLLPLFFIFSAEGALLKKGTSKQIYLQDRACNKARVGDANASCSVVDFKLNKLLKTADTDQHLLFLVEEIDSLTISPVTNPGGNLGEYGARLVSRVTGNTAGVFPSDLSSDIVLISNTFIGRTSQSNPQLTKISVGTTEYALDAQGSAATLGTETLYNQQITGGLPSTGDWENVVLHYSDGTVQPVNYRQKKIAWSELKGTLSSGGGGGGSLYLGGSEIATFQIPTLASTTLSVTTANTPVFHNIASVTGTGIAGKVTQSAVNSVARVTIGQAGYVNLVLEEELRIVSSTAGGSGSVGEIIFVITHYDSQNNDKRSWVWDHSIEDPITTAINMPFSIVTGLTPVNVGDYFTFNFAFNSSVGTRNVVFSLPADNPGLDERMEFIYFPTSSVVPTGPTGPAGPQGPAGPAGTSASQGDSRLIAIDTLPSDLTPYASGQILPINTPSPGRWLEVEGADATERHSFQTTFGEDSNNPQQSAWVVGTDLNFGYSSFGDIFGSLRTADGGKPFNASNAPVMRVEIEREVASVTPRSGADSLYTYTNTITVLIRKTDLPTAPNTIYIRFYSGEPANDNEIDTIELMKGTDNPAHNYHTYTERSGANADGVAEDLDDVEYFNLFTSSPSAGDQTSNPLNLHAVKSTTSFGPTAGLSQTQVDARVDAKVPRNFRSDADTTGILFLPTGAAYGTEAQITSATKVNGTIYYTLEAGQ